jgi:hypothetical protein
VKRLAVLLAIPFGALAQDSMGRGARRAVNGPRTPERMQPRGIRLSTRSTQAMQYN